MNFKGILERSRRDRKRELESVEKANSDDRNWLAGVIGDGFAKIADQFSSTDKVVPAAVSPTITQTDLDTAVQQASDLAFARGVETGLVGYKSQADAAEAVRLKHVQKQQSKAHHDYYTNFRAERLLEDQVHAAEEAQENADKQRVMLDKIGDSDVRTL